MKTHSVFEERVNELFDEQVNRLYDNNPITAALVLFEEYIGTAEDLRANPKDVLDNINIELVIAFIERLQLRGQSLDAFLNRNIVTAGQRAEL
jgi:hypothetical protein